MKTGNLVQAIADGTEGITHPSFLFKKKKFLQNITNNLKAHTKRYQSALHKRGTPKKHLSMVWMVVRIHLTKKKKK